MDIDIDIDISGWILEFLITQNTLDDPTLDDLINTLPIPDNNPRLKKLLILRQVDYDIKTDTISEQTIDLFEQILELDTTEGNLHVSEPMKAAYSTILMHYTVKLIEETFNDNNNDNDNDSDKRGIFVKVIKRVWSDRVREMEKGECLVEGDVLRWVRDIEDAGLDVWENVLGRFRDLDVLEVFRRYVNGVKEKMGPSFVEVACEAVLSDRGLCKDMGLDDVVPVKEMDVDVKSKENEASEARVLTKNKQVSSINLGRSGYRTHGGAKIVDPMETIRNRFETISTAEVNRVKEALEKSSFELRAVVKDPLPEALHYAESLGINTRGEIMPLDHAAGSSTRVSDEAPNSSHDRKDKALAADGDGGSCGDQNETRKPSIMDRNNTAHTVEWSDSIDTSDKGSPTRPHLPTPKKRAVSPLSIYKMNKLVSQRKKRRWTNIEEDTLRTGVQKYGRGNWKLILSMYRDIFEDRTEVDLKDKWRNLTR